MLIHLAGEAVYGLHVHHLHTVRYLRQVVLPNIERGAARTGRGRRDVQLVSSVMVAIVSDEKSPAFMRDLMWSQIAFYASTPTYRVIIDLHGSGNIATQLSQLASRKRWHQMPTLVTDEVLAEFVTEGTWDDIPRGCEKNTAACWTVCSCTCH